MQSYASLCNTVSTVLTLLMQGGLVNCYIAHKVTYLIGYEKI